MANFIYKVSQPSGEILQGERAAASKEDLIAYFHEQGLIVVSVDEKIGVDLGKLTEVQIGDMPIGEKVVLIRQLATMLGAGLPIVQAMEILLQQQTKYPRFKQKITEVYKDIQGGLSLSVSFKKANILFSELQISLIEAGEKSGNLVEIMNQIADDIKNSAQLQGKIKGAMIYPIIIFLTVIAVVLILVIYMVPAVEQLYKDFGQTELPWVTQVLISVSNFFTNPAGLIISIIILIGGVLSFRSFYASKQGRKGVDRMLMRLPIFGDLLIKIEVLQMTRLLAMLVKSGIPIIDALKATSKALTNYHFKYALELAALEVSKGQPIAVPLARSKVIPLIVVRLIATGEETGKLDKILSDIAAYYADMVTEITDNLTKLLEPVILLVAGGVVGFLAVAVYFPIYNLATFIT